MNSHSPGRRKGARFAQGLMMVALTAPFVAPGCGGSPDDPPKGGAGVGGSGAGTAGAGTGGTDRSKGGTSGGGASGAGNANSVGGTSGEAGGSASGAAGAETNGGDGGVGFGAAAGADAGGEAGRADDGGQGGGAGHAGANDAGAGGGGSGVVGVVGTPCSPPGKLACAGNHQKLTVFCGGDGEWEANQTCETGEFCDSTPGENAGTCQTELPECAEGPGTKYCVEDKDLVTCSADAVTTATQTCERACHDGACVDAGECPVWDDYDAAVACSTDCGEPGVSFCAVDTLGCAYSAVDVGPGERAVVRTVWADETCAGCDGTSPQMVLLLTGSSTYGYRITVPPPWRVEVGLSCAVFSECAVSPYPNVKLIAGSPSDGPVSVVIEGLAAPGTCGPSDPGGEGGAGGVAAEAGAAGNAP